MCQFLYRRREGIFKGMKEWSLITDSKKKVHELLLHDGSAKDMSKEHVKLNAVKACNEALNLNALIAKLCMLSLMCSWLCAVLNAREASVDTVKSQ
jgi:hypothetical protein